MGSRRGLNLPEVITADDAANTRSGFGEEPEGGWHRGIPGLRKMSPAELERWRATGGRPSRERFLPQWTEADEDGGAAHWPVADRR